MPQIQTCDGACQEYPRIKRPTVFPDVTKPVVEEAFEFWRHLLLAVKL